MLTVRVPGMLEGTNGIHNSAREGKQSLNGHRIKCFPHRLDLAVGEDNCFFSTFFDHLSFSETVSFTSLKTVRDSPETFQAVLRERLLD